MSKTLNNLRGYVSSAVRVFTGSQARQPVSEQPAVGVELYARDGCWYCGKVLDVLAELQLDHVVHAAIRGSSKRDELVARGGKAQVPYLFDPNTGVEMYESRDIITYLDTTYGEAP